MQSIYSELYDIVDHPAVVFVVCFVLLFLSTRLGAAIKRRGPPLEKEFHDDVSNILGSTLTLSALIISFTFSMAINRYDERKILEEQEANSIGTEYLRSDLFPAAQAEKVRSSLLGYLAERVAFYKTSNERELQQIYNRTARLQNEMWTMARDAGLSQPTPTVTLAIAGMNDVINAQGYTQAAWNNRIPRSAWTLMIAIAVIGNLLLGYCAEHVRVGSKLLMVLPFVFSISFLLIADIESPRGGIIHVEPRNLSDLATSLQSDY
jgi:hypothetical protein